MFKRFLLVTAVALALPSGSALAASYIGYSGYVIATHAGASCFAFAVGPTKGDLEGANWFSINTAASSPLSAAAIAAQVATVQAAYLAANNNVQIGLDWSGPAVNCLLDVADGPFATVPATNINLPKGALQ